MSAISGSCVSCSKAFTAEELPVILWPCKHIVHEVCIKALTECHSCHTAVLGTAKVRVKSLSAGSESSSESTITGNASPEPPPSFKQSSDMAGSLLAGSFLDSIFGFMKSSLSEPKNDRATAIQAIVNTVTNLVQKAKSRGQSDLRIRCNEKWEPSIVDEVYECFAANGLEVLRRDEVELTMIKERITEGHFELGVQSVPRANQKNPTLYIAFETCAVTLVFSKE